jgi:putative ABC transport system permease protein
MGELAVQVLLAVPLGLFFGTLLAHGVMSTVDPEQYRIPVVIETRTYLYSSLVTIGAGVVSALLVRRKVDRLDLIAVLKTRE